MATTDSINARVRQLFCFGFDGAAPTTWIREFLEQGGGGTILFRRNFEHPEQIHALNRELRNLAPDVPALSLVDQEGGPVLRLGEFGSPVPAMATIGATGEPRTARRVGELIGREVRALGFNATAAPVLDVHTRPTNPIIGSRSFGSDPALCGRLGAALAKGLHQTGVLACAKHFPGHGDTTADSHLELPRLEHDRERLEAVELAPFRWALAKEPIGMVMTAHVLYTGVDAELPATVSPAIIDGLLRAPVHEGGLGYDGIVITDDLEMHAMADRFTIEEMVELGLRAGVDQFLICRSEEWQRRAVVHAEKLARDGALTTARLARSQRRIHRVKGFLRALPVASNEYRTRWLRAPEHLELLRSLEAEEASS